MRIHTDSLISTRVIDAARGLPIRLTLTEHQSRTHARAFEISLSGTSNRPNTSGRESAATWDEWGMFLARLFSLDPMMRAGGSAARPIYADAYDFHRKTCDRFVNLTPADQHKTHRWQYNRETGTAMCRTCEAEVRP